MEVVTLMHEIERLPFSKQIYIAQWILKSISQRENKSQMEIAAEQLYADYLNDAELTLFTTIDKKQVL